MIGTTIAFCSFSLYKAVVAWLSDRKTVTGLRTGISLLTLSAMWKQKMGFRISLRNIMLVMMMTLSWSPLHSSETNNDTTNVETETMLPITADTTVAVDDSMAIVAATAVGRQYHFRPAQLVVPAAMIGIGAYGIGNGWLQHHNNMIRDELQENIDKRFTVDDLSQYAPSVAVFALNLCGVDGLHGMGGQAVLLATSAAIMATTVNILKPLTSVQRPDGTSFNSFPSGHTATAFMGAELLRREYWHVSPWIGVAGYAIAASTGFFRMYNNRHWLTDVVAGAGIGILSVEAAYWLYPTITRTFFPKLYEKDVLITPEIGTGQVALACRLTF